MVLDVLTVVLLIAFINPANTPLFVFNSASLSSIRRSRKEAEMLEADIAGSKGQLIVKNLYSGNFSERGTLLPRHSLQVRSSSLT